MGIIAAGQSDRGTSRCLKRLASLAIVTLLSLLTATSSRHVHLKLLESLATVTLSLVTVTIQ